MACSAKPFWVDEYGAVSSWMILWVWQYSLQVVESKAQPVWSWCIFSPVSVSAVVQNVSKLARVVVSDLSCRYICTILVGCSSIYNDHQVHLSSSKLNMRQTPEVERYCKGTLLSTHFSNGISLPHDSRYFPSKQCLVFPTTLPVNCLLLNPNLLRRSLACTRARCWAKSFYNKLYKTYP